MWKRLALVALGAGALTFANQASAQQIGACLSPDGKLTQVTVGAVPNCTGNKTEISWNIQGPKGDTGNQGPTGPQGPQGEPGAPGATPNEVLLGRTTTARAASETELADADCASEFGPEARWANTKDVLTKPWHPSANAACGWTHWYPIQREGDNITDFSGFSGPASQMVCGLELSGAFGELIAPWHDIASDARGFCAGPEDVLPARVACSQEVPVLCVGPAPAPE